MSVRKFYNRDLKMDFINEKLSKSTSYINAYYSLFNLVSEFESFYHKDLYEFNKEDIESFIRDVSPSIRYMSALLYNDLIKDYKKWISKHLNIADLSLDSCSINSLKSISTFKNYTILNDDDITEITEHKVLDGCDYVPVIFIRFLWEIDAQVDISDIINMKITDLDTINNTLIVGGKSYVISNYLTSLIYNFANAKFVDYRLKGKYKIVTAKENGGYVLRTRTTHKSAIGEPLTRSRFSDIFHDFVERNYSDTFNISDIIMSLALKHMLKFKKTHTTMQTERRYFSKVTSHVYGDILVNYGSEKFPIEYAEYLQYFNNYKVNFLQ